MTYLWIGLLFIAAAIVIIVVAKRTAAHRFKCKHCAKEFKIKWTKAIITEHSGSEYKLKCPFCQTNGWCIEQP